MRLTELQRCITCCRQQNTSQHPISGYFTAQQTHTQVIWSTDIKPMPIHNTSITISCVIYILFPSRSVCRRVVPRYYYQKIKIFTIAKSFHAFICLWHQAFGLCVSILLGHITSNACAHCLVRIHLINMLNNAKLMKKLTRTYLDIFVGRDITLNIILLRSKVLRSCIFCECK